MLRIGLTGGIGSGKTTIAKIFSTLGIPVYDADTAAKRLMHTDEQIRQKLIARFGQDVYQDNTLNRSYLSSVVFNDEAALAELNAITHPATIQDADNWFNKQRAAYAIKEAALIFESSSNKYLDYVIGVWAPENIRMQRTLLRGGVTEDQVKSRMLKQMDEKRKMHLCDFVIDNSGIKAVLPQVLELDKKLKALSHH